MGTTLDYQDVWGHRAHRCSITCFHRAYQNGGGRTDATVHGSSSCDASQQTEAVLSVTKHTCLWNWFAATMLVIRELARALCKLADTETEAFLLPQEEFKS